MLLVVLALVVSGLIYWYFLRPMTKWSSIGVSHLKPVPIFGNFLANTLQRESILELAKKIYDAFPGERYVGIYQFHIPFLMVRDPDLIKQIAIKDFDQFHDHNSLSSEELDPMWSKNLFATNGQRWHHLRSTLSPTFSGSKMRAMFGLMQECGKSLTSYFDERNEDVVTVDMKDLFTRFANDVIATCAFGVQCDSLRDKENEFYTRGLEATDFSGFNFFKLVGYQISPLLMKLFNMRIFSESITNFFKGLVHDTIAYRQEKGIVRPDVIHLLLEAGKTDKHGVISSQDDITAQALIFFFAGFETISSTMVFLTYELAINPDIQDRLRAEIDHAVAECEGTITYEAVVGIKYLDMVINESLRKWPVSFAVDRVCNSHYTIQPKLPNEKPVHLKPGDLVWLPQYPIQMDPKYFPDPEKYDPERFADENKDKITPFTYQPFGFGPRNCLGSRFATMEMKIVLTNLLMQFEIVPVKKSVIPVVLSPKHFSPHPKDGMWLGLKRRTAV